MSDGREYEIKFRSRVSDLTRFKRAVDELDGAPLRWTSNRMTSRYFDTEDRRLARRGVSLRIRLSGGKIVQTLKSDGKGSGGFMDRREWEQIIAYSEVNLDALPKDARAALGAVMIHEHTPILETDIRRRTAVIRRPDPAGGHLEVEVALDRGSVAVDGATERFAECELELKQGSIDAFFGLAGELNVACPLPLSSMTKAGRGYQLMRGGAPMVHWGPRSRIYAEQTVHEALTNVFATCIGNIIDNEDTCLDGTDVEAVHEARVSVRRLRSSLKILKPYLEPDRFAWMASDLKWLGGALGPARDWDVYVTETLGTMAGYGLDQDAIAALRRAAEAKRRQAYGPCARRWARNATPG